MFPHDPEPDTFPLYEYTIQPELVESITWSPSNDLCVLVYTDNTLALCRAGITPIWTSSQQASKVTCIAWHPNGQEFVFGCQDGIVYQMNTTHFTLDPIPCWPPVDFEKSAVIGVSSLVWINYTSQLPNSIVPGFDPNAFDIEEYLPSLSMDPLEEPIPALAFQKIQKKPLPEQTRRFDKSQTLLLIGDQNGSLHLSLNAGYHIGTIPCGLLSSKGSISSIELSQDFTMAQVLVKHANFGSYDLVTLDTNVLQKKKQHLCNVAAIEHQIDYLLRYIQHCTKVMESHHAAYTKLAKNNANKISSILNYENDDTIPLPHVELLGLLATGNLNPAIHEYLSAGITPNHAKQWETKANHSYTCLQRIIIENLQPACERLLLQLSKLRGYGLWTERYGDLLCLDSITTAIELTQHYMWSAQQLLKSVGQVAKRFQEFISWICRVVQKLIDQSQRDYQDTTPGPLYQNPDLIMDYLMKDFVKDSLAIYFTESVNDDRSNMVLPSSTDSTPMKQNQFMTILPLPPTLERLVKQCKMILGKPANLMSHFVTHVDGVQLALMEHGDTVDVVLRYMYLPDMKNGIMGSNGREKRRIMAVAASNGLFRVLELDSADDDDDMDASSADGS
ncbi:hypothetical protein [Absidia glauca]|uniref:Anaphase-promoting complex subunit 4 n=1 Tax=Absidia glauca TaxID=4829 RepID=A0A163JFU9_ABSGL|nr:hypothetical protein [Absidia glauca]